MYRKFVAIATVLVVQISVGFSLDFTECGGNPVSAVTIDGCEEVPCDLQTGQTYHVKIRPDYINPQVDNVIVEVGILLYGAYFEQDAAIQNPCIYSCPITTTLIQPEFNVYFNVTTRLRMPAELKLQSRYYHGGQATEGFCISMLVTIVH